MYWKDGKIKEGKWERIFSLISCALCLFAGVGLLFGLVALLAGAEWNWRAYWLAMVLIPVVASFVSTMISLAFIDEVS